MQKLERVPHHELPSGVTVQSRGAFLVNIVEVWFSKRFHLAEVCSFITHNASVAECPTKYLYLQKPVLYDWCNKGRSMCYHVCGI